MRPNINEYFLMMALLSSSRATCSRRKVGAVAVDANNFMLSTGYNGVPKGSNHCTEKECAGSSFGSGNGLEVCKAIHAEINCITHCKDPQSIHTMYVTCTPCIHCMKAVIATGCRRIVSLEIYCEKAMKLFKSVGGRVSIISVDQFKTI